METQRIHKLSPEQEKRAVELIAMFAASEENYESV